MNPLFLLLLILPVFAISLVETKGNALFVNGLSTRFYIRGVDYQPGGSSTLVDPLADKDTCTRDIKYFKDLGVNTIRVYSIDNTADHDDCMLALADAGIYLILDVNLPYASILRSDAKCSYNTMYLNEVLATVKLMSQYDNTLAFFAGNEVINDDNSTAAATYVKAVVRDIKTFQKNTGIRPVPVGYSAADVEQNRLQTAEYFNCGDDDLARVDLFGFNDYSWCGLSSFRLSGYSQKVQEYSNYSIPLFLSEFGCNKVTPRPFTEVEAIYSTQMSAVFSGGLVYEYLEEESKYGLVLIGDDNSTITTNKDYDNLKKEWANTENPSGDGGYQRSLPHSNCPPKGDHWEAEDDIPDTPKGALKYVKGVQDPKGSGLKASTQWACVAKGNDVDDSGSSSSSGSGSSSKSSSGSKSSSSGGSSGSKSSSKKSGAVSVGPANWGWSAVVGLFGAIAGATFI